MIRQIIRQNYPILDFFAGSGLVSLGFSRYFETVWANDNCRKKAQIFCSNFESEAFVLESIENVNGRSLPKAVVSWASFPCQDLSLAGNLKGLDGSRSGLIWQWLRIMKEMKSLPPILIAENVPGLVTAKNGEYYRAVHTELEKLNYQVGAIVLDARHWVPQSRQRVFIIAVSKKLDISGLTSSHPTWAQPEFLLRAAHELTSFIFWNLPKPAAKPKTLSEVVELDTHVDEERSKRSIQFVPKQHLEKMYEFKKMGIEVFTGYKRTRPSGQRLEVRFDGLSGCIRTTKGGSSKQYILYFKKNKLNCRFMTPREAARVMGAPDSFKLPLSQNDAYSAMGDAVAVPVSRFISEKLIRPLADSYYYKSTSRF